MPKMILVSYTHKYYGGHIDTKFYYVMVDKITMFMDNYIYTVEDSEPLEVDQTKDEIYRLIMGQYH